MLFNESGQDICFIQKNSISCVESGAIIYVKEKSGSRGLERDREGYETIRLVSPHKFCWRLDFAPVSQAHKTEVDFLVIDRNWNLYAPARVEREKNNTVESTANGMKNKRHYFGLCPRE